ncbi:MAG: CHASE4 domain-containing protein [Chloroflexota bacterium]
MSLRTKAIVIIAVTLIAVAATVYVTSRLIMMNGLLRIEKFETEENTQRTLNAISQTISTLEANAADWAVWDDTYNFIQDVNSEYIRVNLDGSAFVYLKINLMLFLDSSGRLIYSKAFDLESEETVPPPPQLLDASSRAKLLESDSNASGSVSGIILLDEGPMMIASQPILKSDSTGPARGRLIFGRYLDSEEISRLAQSTLSDISVSHTQGIMELDFQIALRSLSPGVPIFVQTLGTESISGYTLLNDTRGHPVLILKVSIPRDIYKLGEVAVAYHIIAIMIIGLIAAAAVILAVQKQMISRFAVISSGLDKVAATSDLTTRLPISGNDELTSMGRTINGMLAALEESSVEIREREERYRLLAENIQDVIYTADVNTFKVTYISPSVFEMTGYTVEEMLGRSWRELMAPASREVAMKYFAEDMAAVKSGKFPGARTLEFEVVCKDGSKKWVEFQLQLTRDSTGKTAGILGVGRDVTERKKAQEELEKLYQAERSLRQELQAEIAKRMEYTRALVHELKTPITPIMAATELLLEEMKESRLSSLVGTISRSAANLNRRIDELLDLARSELDLLRLHPEPIDMTLLLKEMATEMTAVGLNNKLSVAHDISQLPIVQADRDRIRQVVMNLFNNAVKFTPSGGTITLRARQDNNNLVVTLSDTGAGISEERQKTLFDPYHRVEADRQRLSGLGLGLALAKRFVELHGGRIWVTSERGKGSVFGFSLPLSITKDSETRPGGGYENSRYRR